MKKYISEMIFTFIFVLVVLGVTDDKKGTPVMCDRDTNDMYQH